MLGSVYLVSRRVIQELMEARRSNSNPRIVVRNSRSHKTSMLVVRNHKWCNGIALFDLKGLDENPSPGLDSHCIPFEEACIPFFPTWIRYRARLGSTRFVSSWTNASEFQSDCFLCVLLHYWGTPLLGFDEFRDLNRVLAWRCELLRLISRWQSSMLH